MRRALALASLLLLSCTGASSPTGECLGYSCDEDGAKAMLWATVNNAYQPSERAKTALTGVIDSGVSKMKADGFKPESFELAKGNLQKFLNEIPEGGEDPLAPPAEDLQKKTSKLCPLWPFC